MARILARMRRAVARVKRAVTLRFEFGTTISSGHDEGFREDAGHAANVATLSSLPPEVIELIAGHVSGTDLCALRLASRDMASKVFRTFTSVNFKERGVMMYSLRSLASALEVAQHPIFGKRLQALHLYVDTVIKSRRVLRGPNRYHDPLRSQLYEQFQKDQDQEERQFTATQQLFAQLQAWGGLHTIVITSWTQGMRCDEISKRYPFHLACMDKNVALAVHIVERALDVPGSGQHALKALIMAGSRGVLHPSELIQLEGNHQTPMFESEAFGNLASITLQLQSTSLEDDRIKYLLYALARSKHLASLDLSFEPISHAGSEVFDPTATYYLMECKFSALKTLRLRWVQVSLASMKKFVRGTPSLETITLAGSALLELPQYALRVALQEEMEMLPFVQRTIEFEGLRVEDMDKVWWYEAKM